MQKVGIRKVRWLGLKAAVRYKQCFDSGDRLANFKAPGGRPNPAPGGTLRARGQKATPGDLLHGAQQLIPGSKLSRNA
jgi:hypothetical protein